MNIHGLGRSIVSGVGAAGSDLVRELGSMKLAATTPLGELPFLDFLAQDPDEEPGGGWEERLSAALQKVTGTGNRLRTAQLDITLDGSLEIFIVGALFEKDVAARMRECASLARERAAAYPLASKITGILLLRGGSGEAAQARPAERYHELFDHFFPIDGAPQEALRVCLRFLHCSLCGDVPAAEAALFERSGQVEKVLRDLDIAELLPLVFQDLDSRRIVKQSRVREAFFSTIREMLSPRELSDDSDRRAVAEFMKIDDLERVFTDAFAGRAVQAALGEIKEMSLRPWPKMKLYTTEVTRVKDSMLKKLKTIFSGGGPLDYARREMGFEFERKLGYELEKTLAGAHNVMETARRCLCDLEERLDRYVHDEEDRWHRTFRNRETDMKRAVEREAEALKSPFRKLSLLASRRKVGEELEHAAREYVTAAARENMAPHFTSLLRRLREAAEARLAAVSRILAGYPEVERAFLEEANRSEDAQQELRALVAEGCAATTAEAFDLALEDEIRRSLLQIEQNREAMRRALCASLNRCIGRGAQAGEPVEEAVLLTCESTADSLIDRFGFLRTLCRTLGQDDLARVLRQVARPYLAFAHSVPV